MRNLIKRIVLSAFYTPFFKNKLFAVTLDYLKNNKGDFEYFVSEFNTTFPGQIDKYSTLYNDGYKHIEEAIKLSAHFKLSPENIIVDVGAAAGHVALMFAGKLPQSRIYSFEPIGNTYQLLQESVKKVPTIKTINKALGSQQGTSEIHVAHRFTSSSLFPIEKEIKNEFFSENLKETRTEQITISTLDTEIPSTDHVNILKIDVQGYELEVLKGAEQTLKRTNIVLLELMNHSLYTSAPLYHELDSFLRKNDFVLYNIIPSIYQDNKLYEWDAIYVNKRIVSE